MQRTDFDPSRALLRAVLSVAGVVVFVVAFVNLRRYDLDEARSVASISLAYTAVGLFGFRFRIVRDVVARWVLGAGLALAALEITNIFLEQFVGLPSPANAIVPASMMAVIVLFASTSAVVGSARHSVWSGVASAVAVIALGMLMSCAVVLAYAQGGVVAANPEAFSRLMLANAALHLTAPPLLALPVGLLAAAVSRETARHPFRVSVLTSFAALPLLGIGVGLLVYAASLPRSARPAFVLPGMSASAFALVCLPSFLARRRASTVTA